MVLWRFLLPRVLVVTALIPVPRVNIVHHTTPGVGGEAPAGDMRPAAFRRLLLLRLVNRHPARGIIDRGVAVSTGR